MTRLIAPRLKKAVGFRLWLPGFVEDEIGHDDLEWGSRHLHPLLGVRSRPDDAGA